MVGSYGACVFLAGVGDRVATRSCLRGVAALVAVARAGAGNDTVALRPRTTPDIGGMAATRLTEANAGEDETEKQRLMRLANAVFVLPNVLAMSFTGQACFGN